MPISLWCDGPLAPIRTGLDLLQALPGDAPDAASHTLPEDGPLRRPPDLAGSRHRAAVAGSVGQRPLQTGVTLVILPHWAFYSLDAILRTLLRLAITRTAAGMESFWRPGADEPHVRPRCHGIGHLFVLAGSASHNFGIPFYH